MASWESLKARAKAWCFSQAEKVSVWNCDTIVWVPNSCQGLKSDLDTKMQDSVLSTIYHEDMKTTWRSIILVKVSAARTLAGWTNGWVRPRLPRLQTVLQSLMGVSLVEIPIPSDIIDIGEGIWMCIIVYHHFEQEIVREGPENMHRELCCTISCKGRSSWLLGFEKRCTGNAYSQQVLYSRIIWIVCLLL